MHIVPLYFLYNFNLLLDIYRYFNLLNIRKSVIEHKSQLSNMDKEKRQMEEAIANSLIDQKRLEGEREKQRLELVAHFKSKVATNTADINSAKNTGITLHMKF